MTSLCDLGCAHWVFAMQSILLVISPPCMCPTVLPWQLLFDSCSWYAAYPRHALTLYACMCALLQGPTDQAEAKLSEEAKKTK